LFFFIFFAEFGFSIHLVGGAWLVFELLEFSFHRMAETRRKDLLFCSFLLFNLAKRRLCDEHRLDLESCFIAFSLIVTDLFLHFKELLKEKNEVMLRTIARNCLHPAEY
jgi:hypothetical protein